MYDINGTPIGGDSDLSLKVNDPTFSGYMSMGYNSNINVGDTDIAKIGSLIRTSIMSNQYYNTITKFTDKYAHCPSVCIKNGKAYVVAFQNAESSVDTYLLDGSSSELYIVDIERMAVVAQHKLAGHLDTVEGLTFKYGSGACQGIFVDDNTLRSVFVAKLSDEEWYQCYRDFDISTGALEPNIHLCQIKDNGVSYVFNTANAHAHIQAMTELDHNTNIVCQTAKVGDTWYVAMGCLNEYKDMPILTTKDWITFEYWATPSTDVNDAKYEMAIASDGTYLYTATRQKSKDFIEVMKVRISDKTVTAHIEVPDGNRSRPFIYLSGNKLYLSHILTTARLDGSTITAIPTGLNGYYTHCDLPPMVYPFFEPYGKDKMFVAFMYPYSLRFCLIDKIDLISQKKAVAMSATLLSVLK